MNVLRGNQLLKMCIAVYKNKWSCAIRTRDMQAHRLMQFPLRCRDKKQILVTQPVSQLVEIAMLWRTVLKCNSHMVSRTLKLTSNYLYVLEPSAKKMFFPFIWKRKHFLKMCSIFIGIFMYNYHLFIYMLVIFKCKNKKWCK